MVKAPAIVAVRTSCFTFYGGWLWYASWRI